VGVVSANLWLRNLLAQACPDCLDTTVGLGLYGPEPCTRCLTSGKQVKPVTLRLADYVWGHTATWKKEDTETLIAARIFHHASAALPITGPVISAHLGINTRTLKGYVETIRRDWHLPLISQRKGGGGYWYAETAGQFLEWFRTMRSQAVNELATAHGMLRSNFPTLAGQDSLDFIRSFSEELKEAL